MISLEHAQPLDPAQREALRFRRQWCIVPPTEPTRSGWCEVPLTAQRVLRHHPELHVERVGQLIVLGLAFDALHPADSIAERLAAHAGSHEAISRALVDVAGCYAIVRCGPDGVALYADPGGIRTIFHAEGRAASTPLLLGAVERDPDLEREFPLGGADDWYPGSHTPFRGVSALTGNHWLRLETGRSERYWPLADFSTHSRELGLRAACTQLQGSVEALLERGPVLASLTGGRDSRVSLAASRAHLDRVDFFTIEGGGVKDCDVKAPAEMAARFGLRHQRVAAGPAPDWVLELYDEIASGMAIGASREIAGACRQLAGPSYTHLNGNLGAITKSFFWHSHRPREVRRSALAKEFVNKAPPVWRAVDEFLAGLPELRPSTAYNLMYLEQRGSRYMGIRETASALYYDPCPLFNNRRVFEAICGMPDEVLWGGQLLVDLVEMMWPELLDVPYCKVTRNWGTFLPKALKHRIRRLMGS